MKFVIPAPKTTITIASIFIIFAVSVALWVATNTPWFGVDFNKKYEGKGIEIASVNKEGPSFGLLNSGDVIVGIRTVSGDIAISQDELLEEPDELPTYQEYNDFLQKQGLIYNNIDGKSTTFILANGQSVTVHSEPSQPISNLPFLLWYQIICAVFFLLTGVFVWAFRFREVVAIYYFLTGLGLFISATAASIYSTREFVLDSSLFYTLSLMNQFGTFFFAGPFLSILMIYPKKLFRTEITLIVIATYQILWLMNALQLQESLDVGVRYPMIIGMILVLGLAVTHWRISKDNPVTRAITKWFLFAWLSGATIFTGLIMVPLVLGIEGFITQSMAWGVLFTGYLGIALGITRYRLFDLDRWIVNGWIWLISGVVVLFIDALLVFNLNLDHEISLLISLFIAGWLYFPLRQRIYAHFTSYSPESEIQNLLPETINYILSNDRQSSWDLWHNVLQRIFKPLSVERYNNNLVDAVIKEDGVVMLIPAIDDSPAVKLSYAEHANRLFNKNDLKMAESLHKLVWQVTQFHDALISGALQERKRVARDLHDDVGARLLSLIYSLEDGDKSDLAREALQELRNVISDLEIKEYQLANSLINWQSECIDRCQQADIKLQWNQADIDSSLTLTSRQNSNLQRVLREAVTNAIRHGKPDYIYVNVFLCGHELNFEVKNDNNKYIEGCRHGRGMRNMHSRINELEGTIEWRSPSDMEDFGCIVTWGIAVK